MDLSCILILWYPVTLKYRYTTHYFAEDCPESKPWSRCSCWGESLCSGKCTP